MKQLPVFFCRGSLGIALIAVSLFSCSRRDGEAERAYLAATEAYRLEDYPEVIGQCRRALETDRGFYQAEFLLGKTLFFSGEEAEALKVFTRLTKKHPEYTEARLWLVRCLVLGGQYGQAAVLLDRELSFNSTDWRALYLYALLAQRTGDYEKRLSMGRQAETALGDSARVYLDLAIAWHALGLEERAGDYLKKAQTVSGSNASLQRIEESLERFSEEELP
jgi:tetratricopeptide (TPR) repeat protein